MDNQASEGSLTYGVDLGITGGYSTALSIKKGSTLFTFTGDEAVAIIDVIRTEKLKLLDNLERKSTHYTPDGLVADSLDPWAVSVSTINTVRNKLEAEL